VHVVEQRERDTVGNFGAVEVELEVPVAVLLGVRDGAIDGDLHGDS
jgi:hypothetical protein